jgi:hypothetical protein
VQIRHQRCAEFLPDGEALFGRLAVDATLDLEQGIEALHGFQRDRIDHASALTTALLRAASEEPDMEYAMVDATIVKVHRHGQGAKGGLRARPLSAPKAA